MNTHNLCFHGKIRKVFSSFLDTAFIWKLCTSEIGSVIQHPSILLSEDM